MENFNIVLALVRCSLLNNPNDATIHQIVRLKNALESQDERQFKLIDDLLNNKDLIVTGKIIKS